MRPILESRGLLERREDLVGLAEQLGGAVRTLEEQVRVVLPGDAHTPWSWIDSPVIHCSASEQ